MPDSWTSGKLSIIKPANGGYVNVWDGPLASNWITLDAAVSGTTTIALSNLNVVLVTPTYPTSPNPAGVTNATQNLRLLLTGVLTANVSVSIPSGIPGMWLVDNSTTGSAYSVTINTTSPGSGGVLPPRGYLSYIFSDGFNVVFADLGGIKYGIESFAPKTPAGAIFAFGGSATPAGYLACNGTAVSRTTYADLFSAIGTTWGAGDNTTTFNVPNLQNMFLRGSGASPVGTFEDEDFKSHTHSATVNDPGHTHTINSQSGFSGGPGYMAQSAILQGTYATNSSLTGITVSNSSSGGTETRPKNYRVLYIIKT